MFKDTISHHIQTTDRGCKNDFLITIECCAEKSCFLALMWMLLDTHQHMLRALWEHSPSWHRLLVTCDYESTVDVQLRDDSYVSRLTVVSHFSLTSYSRTKRCSTLRSDSFFLSDTENVNTFKQLSLRNSIIFWFCVTIQMYYWLRLHLAAVFVLLMPLGWV